MLVPKIHLHWSSWQVAAVDAARCVVLCRAGRQLPNCNCAERCLKLAPPMDTIPSADLCRAPETLKHNSSTTKTLRRVSCPQIRGGLQRAFCRYGAASAGGHRPRHLPGQQPLQRPVLHRPLRQTVRAATLLMVYISTLLYVLLILCKEPVPTPGREAHQLQVQRAARRAGTRCAASGRPDAVSHSRISFDC